MSTWAAVRLGDVTVRNGFKIFDADAHVIYPADLWSRYLDKRYVGRLGSKQPVPGFETYNPVTVDGRWTQHDTILYGQFQKYIDWTKDDMIAKYGEELVLDGFTGDRVASALARDGIDLSVIYGPEYDLWFDGIDPDLQAAMVRAYNRWGADMRATSGGRVHTAGPVPLNDVTRAIAEIEHAYHQLGIRAFWARPGRVQPSHPGRSLLRPDVGVAPGPRRPLLHPRIHGAPGQFLRQRQVPRLLGVAHRGAPVRGHGGHRLDDLPRRLRTVPPATGGLPRSGMRMAPELAAPD